MSDDVRSELVTLRDRVAADAGQAKTRADYLMLVAYWSDLNRVIDQLP